MFGFFKKKVVSLDHQLAKLAEFGVTFNEGIEPAIFLEEVSRDFFEEDPYLSLLICMGGEISKGDTFVDSSDHIWYFDTECIEDHGVYSEVIERLKKMTELDIRNIKDCVDIDNGVVWVSFTFDNQQVKWDLQMDYDWLDVGIFEKFNDLIKNKSSKRIVVTSIDQSCLITYLTEEQLRGINRLVKYKLG